MLAKPLLQLLDLRCGRHGPARLVANAGVELNEGLRNELRGCCRQGYIDPYPTVIDLGVENPSRLFGLRQGSQTLMQLPLDRNILFARDEKDGRQRFTLDPIEPRRFTLQRFVQFPEFS